MATDTRFCANHLSKPSNLDIVESVSDMEIVEVVDEDDTCLASLCKNRAKATRVPPILFEVCSM